MNDLPITETRTGYYIALANDPSTYFSKEGYSQYYVRLKICRDKKRIAECDIYGYEQALAHIEELRAKKHEGKQPYKNADFIIKVVTTVATHIAVPYTKK
jgi:hypothetical protein